MFSSKFDTYCNKFFIDSKAVNENVKYMITLIGALRETEALWFKQAEIEPSFITQGTTACVSMIRNNYIMVANLGDSSAFLLQ